jgi:hypothetical protein
LEACEWLLVKDASLSREPCLSRVPRFRLVSLPLADAGALLMFKRLSLS